MEIHAYVQIQRDINLLLTNVYIELLPFCTVKCKVSC